MIVSRSCAPCKTPDWTSTISRAVFGRFNSVLIHFAFGGTVRRHRSPFIVRRSPLVVHRSLTFTNEDRNSLSWSLFAFADTPRRRNPDTFLPPFAVH
jgi:hypothetical protein